MTPINARAQPPFRREAQCLRRWYREKSFFGRIFIMLRTELTAETGNLALKSMVIRRVALAAVDVQWVFVPGGSYSLPIRFGRGRLRAVAGATAPVAQHVLAALADTRQGRSFSPRRQSAKRRSAREWSARAWSARGRTPRRCDPAPTIARGAAAAVAPGSPSGIGDLSLGRDHQRRAGRVLKATFLGFSSFCQPLSINR